MGNFIVRGIVIGGSLGVFAALLGISDNIFRSVGFGMIAGFLAGLTLSLKKRG